MPTTEFRRKANVSPDAAIDALKKKFPGCTIESFTTVNGQYIARVTVAEFPPAKDDPADSSEDGPKTDTDTAPEPAEDDGPDEESVDDEAADEKKDTAPPKPGDKKDKGKGGDAVEHEILHLLKLVVDGLGLAPEGDPASKVPGEGPGMPPAGPDPNASPDGPPPPVADKAAPLPPPVEKHGPGAPGGLGMPFSKVASARRSFVIWREDGDKVTIKQAAAEARELVPATHELKKIERKRAKVDGVETSVILCGFAAKG